ncbi:MAG: TIR domain-containing protein [Acidobacteria bacterium]|nr:TIR domain-containing protein [Acidobacteriota bacterium]
MSTHNPRFDPKQVSRIILDCLKRGKPVEIEGFGTFHPQSDGGFEFVAMHAPRVFISYAAEDRKQAQALYDALAAAGLNPWLDRRNLKAGQNWPRLIEAAIEASDFFVACMSSNSVLKRGGFQAEIRYALDIARRLPLEDTFIIPVRFDEYRACSHRPRNSIHRLVPRYRKRHSQPHCRDPAAVASPQPYFAANFFLISPARLSSGASSRNLAHASFIPFGFPARSRALPSS